MIIDYTNGYYEGEVNSKEEHHGRGKFVYNSGDKYIGEYRNNKMCGRGIYYFSDCTIYDGEWLDNKKHGHGKMTYPDGGYYEGEWLDDLMHGKGKFYSPGGVVYDGAFEKGKKLYGKEIYSWGYYEGEFKDNKWHGNGKVIHNDGSYFTGTFEDSMNVMDVTYVEANGEISHGKIIDNEFIEEKFKNKTQNDFLRQSRML